MLTKTPLKRVITLKANSNSSSYERFKNLYTTRLNKTLSVIIKEGRSINFSILKLLLLLISPYILMGIFSTDSFMTFEKPLRTPTIIINILFFIFIFYLGFNLYKKYKRFVNKYKRMVIEPIIKVINPSFKYFPEKHIAINDYLDSDLFRMHEHFHGDDLISGTIDDFDFEMSEVHTYHHTGHGKNRQKHNIFDGLFFIFKYKKNLQSLTYIFPDLAERFLGKIFGQTLQSFISSNAKGDLVKLENPVFEKIFKVTSTNQIEARTILTPVMMEKMVDFYKDVNQQPLYFAFKNNLVYVAISRPMGSKAFTNNQYFEPPSLFFNPKAASFNFAKKIYDCINIPVEIAKEINDNASVWKR